MLTWLLTWFWELDPVAKSFLIFTIVWFLLIFCCIPVQLYFGKKALKAEQRSAVLQAKGR
jgi:hypothetical protein